MKENNMNILDNMGEDVLNGTFPIRPMELLVTDKLNNLTVIPNLNSVDGYTLNDMKAGLMVMFQANKSSEIENLNIPAIHRGLIGYGLATQFIGDKNLFNLTMMNLLQQASKEFVLVFGSDQASKYVAYFGFPEGTYFKDRQEFAAYEYRIVFKLKE